MNINQFSELIELKGDDFILCWNTENEITAKTKISTLKSYLGASANGSQNSRILNYVNNGDSNGVFYFIGTNKLSQGWTNPQLSGAVNITAISYYPGAQNPHFLVSRVAENDISTNSATNPWFLFDLKNYKLRISAYTIQGRARDGQNPKSWIIQGSNNGTVFIDLHTVLNDPINNNQWKVFQLPSTIPEAYRYIRFWQTENSAGTPYLTMGEIEFYGILEWNQ